MGEGSDEFIFGEGEEWEENTWEISSIFEEFISRAIKREDMGTCTILDINFKLVGNRVYIKKGLYEKLLNSIPSHPLVT